MQSPSAATNRERRKRVLKMISPVMFKWAALNYTPDGYYAIESATGVLQYMVQLAP